MHTVSRRDLITAGAATAAAIAGARTSPTKTGAAPGASGFSFCLNTSTIRGQKLEITDEISLIAKAGYDGIEPWIAELNQYVGKGGKLSDLRKQLDDCGLTVENGIGFAKWIVDDPQERAQGLEQMKRDMDTIAQIGGRRIAAPPVGATKGDRIDLRLAAERYRTLLELGDKTSVTPLVELWGFSENLSRLGDCICVAVESGHPNACFLADIYHIYKGGSDFTGLKLLSNACVPLLHANDYPDIARDKISDADRVYPGDGIAPVIEILTTLKAHGGCVLSLELFNPNYWKQDAAIVAATGLSKLKYLVEQIKPPQAGRTLNNQE